MRIRLISLLGVLVLVVSACSSSSSDSGEAATDAESPATTESASTDTAAPAVSTTEASAAPSSGGSGTATVTLDNGESYTFSIICGLEAQEVAGSEILFTAVSYDKPYGFDVTQFGKMAVDTGGVLDDLGTITIYDSETYDDVWGAGSVTAQLDGSEFILELNGTTITGSGMFFEGDALENLDTAVHGELVAECG